MFQSTVSTVAMLFLLIAVGWWLGGKEWFRGGDRILSRYLTKAALPCLVFCNVLQYFPDAGEIRELWDAGIFILVILAAALVTGLFFGKVLCVRRNRRGIFVGAVLFPNVILLGFPIIEGTLGEEAMPYAVIFFMIDTIVFWTAGPLLLTLFEGERKFRPENLKKIFSGSLFAILIGFLFLGFDIPVPGAIGSALEKMAQSTTAVSMVFIGAVIRGTKLKKMESVRDIVWAVVLKTGIIPAVILMILKICPLDFTGKSVLFLLAVMPIAVNFSVIAHEYKCDHEYSAILTSVLNLIGLAAIPLYVYAITRFRVFG